MKNNKKNYKIYKNKKTLYKILKNQKFNLYNKKMKI